MCGEAITDSTGRFEILQIVPGRYNITIKGEGYRTNEIARYLIGRTNILQNLNLLQLPQICRSS
ncbi:MAG: carboxypeptidase regulatory-like domain-containing protein [Saprospiraceae bacterium]|nr:carboxypeptidase regulatory-like domain-containing protein [Saprospiraceae bacterium]